MTHGYSLRPNAKGRRGHQSTDDSDGHVEGTNTSTSEGHDLTAADPCPATPEDDAPSAARNPPNVAPDSEHQSTEDDQRRSTATHHLADTGSFPTYRGGGGGIGPRETWEEIQAGRKREEARRYAEAVRIQREQVVRGFEEEIRAMRARILALRGECEAKVAQVRGGWERARAIERGEVVVVVEDDDDELDLEEEEDGGGGMEVEINYAPTEASWTTTDNDGDGDEEEQWQQWHQQWPPSRRSHESQANFDFPPLWTKSRKTQQQQPPPPPSPPYMGGISASSVMVGPSRPEPEPEGGREEEDAHRRPRPSLPLPQPLRRQSAQLMAIPIATSSLGLHTHARAVQDPESRYYGTDGDNDSEMGEVNL